MKTYKQITCSDEDEIVCDRCERRDECDGMEGQEFLSHDMSCGFASVFGDLNHVRVDLCQHCVKEVLGQWVRVYGEMGELIPTALQESVAHTINDMSANNTDAAR